MATFDQKVLGCISHVAPNLPLSPFYRTPFRPKKSALYCEITIAASGILVSIIELMLPRQEPSLYYIALQQVPRPSRGLRQIATTSTPGKPEKHTDESTDPQTVSTRQICLVLHTIVVLSGLSPDIEIRLERRNDLVPISYHPNDNILYVDPMWQNPVILHWIFPCTASKLTRKDVPQAGGLCDHLLEELCRKALHVMHTQHPLPISTQNWVIRCMRNNLRYMPRYVKIDKSGKAQLSVIWATKGPEFPFTAHRSKPEYHIVLHGDSCNAVDSSLFHGHSGTYSERHMFSPDQWLTPWLITLLLVCFPEHKAVCGCPQQLVSNSLRSVTFANLDCSQKYYGMVSVNQDMAFWGVSTRSVHPDAGDNCDEPGECHMTSFEKPSQSSLSHCQSLSPLYMKVLQKQQRRGIAEMIRTSSRAPEKNHRL